MCIRDRYTIDEDNASFWVDINGNVHIKGTLEGCDGKFSGELVAASGDVYKRQV